MNKKVFGCLTVIALLTSHCIFAAMLVAGHPKGDSPGSELPMPLKLAEVAASDGCATGAGAVPEYVAIAVVPESLLLSDGMYRQAIECVAGSTRFQGLIGSVHGELFSQVAEKIAACRRGEPRATDLFMRFLNPAIIDQFEGVPRCGSPEESPALYARRKFARLCNDLFLSLQRISLKQYSIGPSVRCEKEARCEGCERCCKGREDAVLFPWEKELGLERAEHHNFEQKVNEHFVGKKYNEAFIGVVERLISILQP